MKRAGRKRQRGNTLVEFALVTVFLVPLLFGTVNVGMNITRAMKVTQISRDAGHMFARYVDFSLTANKQLIVHLGSGLGMTLNGGPGRVTLSQIMYVGTAECTAGGLTVAQCTNLNWPVIVKRIVIGNTALAASSFGTPNPGLIDSQGNVADYLREGSARATNFNSLLALQPGEYAYVAEAYFQSPVYDFLSSRTGTALYARTIF
ncbi:MAG: hypothetical protein KIT09_35455 [Bryobacteraceae bacterium]|nr:hypothetical protein [Bryobacteraceae bacterium]